MSFRERTDFDRLPSELKSVIQGQQFIKAYQSDNPGNIIVWVVHVSRDRQAELEYDVVLGRMLTRAEREQLFPPRTQVRLDSLGVRVDIGYRLTDDCEVLCQTYDVYRDGATAAPLRCAQMMYFPTLDPIEEVVGRELEKADFPARYAAWPVSEKISYWVAMLFRRRRHTGENGHSPDEAFDAALIPDSRRLDSNIEAILPEIIRGLALMESAEPADLLARFNARTGAILS